MYSKLKILTLPAASLLLAIGTPAQALVTFNFNYTDAGGVGFNDVTEGADRRAALQSAGDYLSGFLTNYTADIFLDVDGSVADGSTLAAAGAEVNGPISTGFGNQGDVMLKILGGNSADPSAGRDGSVTWNFADFSWELGTAFDPNQYDFFSTAVHELLHALGFGSDIAQNGDDPVTGDPTGNWSPFDKFVADSTGDIIDNTSFVLDQVRWDVASVAGGACGTGLIFNGPNTMAANGGNPVEIYSVSPWEDGSSGSHLDDNCYNGTYMMEAATGTGLGIRQLSALEIGMMQDMGYTQFGVTTPPPPGQVPAPPIIYLLAGGLVLLRLSRKNTSQKF